MKVVKTIITAMASVSKTSQYYGKIRVLLVKEHLETDAAGNAYIDFTGREATQLAKCIRAQRARKGVRLD